MDNLKKLTEKIQRFFSSVEVHETEIENLVQEAKKPCHSIVNQSLILRSVLPKHSVQNSALKKFKGFREDLLDIIATSLEAEVVYLEEIRNKFQTVSKNLRKEQKSIQTIYSNLKTQGLINPNELNPCSPLLEHIIDWCHDIWCYYHSYYLQVSQAIINLNFEDEDTITALSNSFKENSEEKKHINRIKSYKLSNFDLLA